MESYKNELAIPREIKQGRDWEAEVLLKLPEFPIYRLVLLVEGKSEPITVDSPECLNEQASIDGQDFPNMVVAHGAKLYIQGSSTMLDKSKSRAGISLITSEHLSHTIGGLFRRWMGDSGVTAGQLRATIRNNRFILFKYKMEPTKFDPVMIRLQADPKTSGHYLARPAVSMPALAWKQLFNEGVVQKGTFFEISSDELDKWRSANSFLKPPKEAVNNVFAGWL